MYYAIHYSLVPSRCQWGRRPGVLLTRGSGGVPPAAVRTTLPRPRLGSEATRTTRPSSNVEKTTLPQPRPARGATKTTNTVTYDPLAPTAWIVRPPPPHPAHGVTAPVLRVTHTPARVGVTISVTGVTSSMTAVTWHTPRRVTPVVWRVQPAFTIHPLLSRPTLTYNTLSRYTTHRWPHPCLSPHTYQYNMCPRLRAICLGIHPQPVVVPCTRRRPGGGYHNLASQPRLRLLHPHAV